MLAILSPRRIPVGPDDHAQGKADNAFGVRRLSVPSVPPCVSHRETGQKFWPMHDLLLENETRFGGALFARLGSYLGLNADALQQALDEGRFAERVRHDFSSGARSGVNGTPTFFINGRRQDADFEFETLVEAIGSQMGR